MAVSQKRTMIPSDSGYMKATRFSWVKFTESQWKPLIYNPKILGIKGVLSCSTGDFEVCEKGEGKVKEVF